MLRAIAVFLLIAFLAGGAWWMTRPSVPDQASVLYEQSLSNTHYSEAAAASLAQVQKVSRQLGLPSVSVAVSVKGETVWGAALGFADVAKNREATLSTRYRTGSVSKVMTGLTAAKLVQSGKLDLDIPIHQYVPDFPEKRWNFTARQLGSHTAGIRHYANPGERGFWTEQFSNKHYGSIDDSLAVFKEEPLLFEPGTAFQYSTHGFTLLGAVMESAAGVPYPQLMTDTLWSPAGMEATQLEDFTRDAPHRATPYMTIAGRLIPYEGPDPSYKRAGAGALSTPTDLVRMGGLFLTDKIISGDLQAELFVPRNLADGSPNPEGYALGLRNGQMAESWSPDETIAVLHHGGSSPGGSSFLLLLPDEKVAVAAMTNVLLGNSDAFRDTVYEIARLFREANR